MSSSQSSSSPPASRALARGLVPVLLLCICLFATAASAQAAATKWTERTVPSIGGFGKLLAVSCTSSTFCTSVGWQTVPGGNGTLAAQWNGEKWTLESVPAPAGSASAELTGVSCYLKSYCMAVGTAVNASNKQVPFAARWTAGAWTLQSLPVPAVTEGASLSGVSCYTGLCFAVGSNKAAGGYKPIVESWNGTTWTLEVLEKAPFSSGVEGLKLGGISCANLGRCTAVGSYKTTGAGFKPFAATLSAGPTWTVELPSAGTGLEAVSCSTMTACTASGYSVVSLLSQSWNGTTWAAQTTPNPADLHIGSLTGVSCPASTTVCVSVGSYEPFVGATKAVAQRFEGGAWTLDSPPEYNGITVAVSCASATACMATGYKGTQPYTATAVRVNAPVVKTVPVITPTQPKTGSLETTTVGTWTEEPTSFTYQWRRCSAAGTECVNISGATGSSYTPLATDLGKKIQSQVTAYNVAGSATASSELSAVIKE